MKRKILSLLLALAMVLPLCPEGLFSFTANAVVTGGASGWYTYTVSNNEATITEVNTSISGDVVIPSYLGWSNYPVTAIGNYAFYGCSNITSVTIPKSVTTIGAYAFDSCSNISSIEIPDSVITIGSYAFYKCSSLTSIVISKSITSIGYNAFYGCSGLESITVAEENSTYHSSGDCLIETKNKTLILGCKNSIIPADESVNTIGEAAFALCNRLTSIVIPDGVASIGKDAFSFCSSLTSIAVPDGVTNIGNYAFCYCDNLSFIVLPNSVTTIGEGAFLSCNSLNVVYYAGPATDRAKLSNASPALSRAVWHCNSCLKNADSYTHIYNNICDTVCNKCNEVREVPHVFDNACDTTCNECGFVRTVPAHVYNNACDAYCNACGLERQVPDHIYDNVCDATCNTCSLERQVLGHVYNNACDTSCNACGLERQVPDHIYDNACDTTCNECGHEREVAPHFVEEIVLPHTLNNPTSYPFALSGGWYTSTNKSNSSSSTFTLVSNHNCSIVIRYKVSSEQNYDKLTIKQNSTTLDTISGSVSEKTLTVTLVVGDQLTFTYSKDYSQYSGSDTASFKIESCTCGEKTPAAEIEPTCATPVICSGCGIEVKPASTIHTYDNACDTDCNVCFSIRTITHEYSVLDKNESAHWMKCAVCGTIDETTRAIHSYDNNCDAICNDCSFVRSVPGHIYDNDCDTECNECGEKRAPSHSYSNSCDNDCNVCGEKRIPPHSYSSDCDDECNGCGNLREVPDHTYDNTVDTDCNICGFVRELPYDAYGTTGKCFWYKVGTKLTIFGSGAMGNYTYNSTLPWGTSITEVVIENGVTNVGNFAFYFCKSLTSTVLPNGVTSIGNYSFSGCNSLKSITIPNSIKSFGDGAFSSCSSLPGIIIPDGVTFIGAEAFYHCSKIKDITIPDSVISIGEDAFRMCSFKSLFIPKNVTSIGSGVTSWCTALTSLEVDENNTVYYSSGNCIMKKSNNALIAGCKTSVIPNGVTAIEENAFAGINVVSITIPDSVTKIGAWAFCGAAFTSITIPKSLTDIAYGAFYLCSYLSDVYYSGTKIDKNNIKILGSNTELTGAKWHFIPCENDTHLYDYACGTVCKNCDYVRTEGAVHIYDDDCDEICNICGELRKAKHMFAKVGENTATCKNCFLSKTFDFIITTDEMITLSYEASKEFDFVIEDTSIAKISNVSSSIISSGSYYRQVSSAKILSVYPGETVVKIVTTSGTILTSSTLLVAEGEHQMQYSGVIKEPSCTEPGKELYVCKFCGHEEEVEIPPLPSGDLDGNDAVDSSDAIYLLYYTLFGEERYPVNQPCDYDKDGTVSSSDAIYLLYHTLFGKERYPL